jgi:hypothetical protein
VGPQIVWYLRAYGPPTRLNTCLVTTYVDPACELLEYTLAWPLLAWDQLVRHEPAYSRRDNSCLHWYSMSSKVTDYAMLLLLDMLCFDLPDWYYLFSRIIVIFLTCDMDNNWLSLRHLAYSWNLTIVIFLLWVQVRRRPLVKNHFGWFFWLYLHISTLLMIPCWTNVLFVILHDNFLIWSILCMDLCQFFVLEFENEANFWDMLMYCFDQNWSKKDMNINLCWTKELGP